IESSKIVGDADWRDECGGVGEAISHNSIDFRPLEPQIEPSTSDGKIVVCVVRPIQGCETVRHIGCHRLQTIDVNVARAGSRADAVAQDAEGRAALAREVLSAS